MSEHDEARTGECGAAARDAASDVATGAFGAAGKRDAATSDNATAVRDAALYLVELIRCGLHDGAAPVLPAGVTWARVYALAARNSVEGVSWFGARTRDDVPPDLRTRWKSAADSTLFRLVQFDAERERVLAAMDERGLSHLPLKGVLVAGYYPHPEMRSMADNDILYGFVEPDPAGGFRVRGTNEDARQDTVAHATRTMVDVMKHLGYKAVQVGAGNHDSFHKEPLFNFEMHRRLVVPTSPFWDYYANPWKRAMQDARNPHAFSFRDEDEYVYLLVHAFKHYDGAGSGFRFAVDLRVFLDRKGANMDWTYVAKQLCELGLEDFEAEMRGLADAAFGAIPSLSDAQKRLLCELLGCGTYGTMQARVEREVERLARESGNSRAASAKLRYLLKRLTPDEVALAERHPLLRRHPQLLPLFGAARIGKGLLHPLKSYRELRVLKRVTPPKK